MSLFSSDEDNDNDDNNNNNNNHNDNDDNNNNNNNNDDDSPLLYAPWSSSILQICLDFQERNNKNVKTIVKKMLDDTANNSIKTNNVAEQKMGNEEQILTNLNRVLLSLVGILDSLLLDIDPELSNKFAKNLKLLQTASNICIVILQSTELFKIVYEELFKLITINQIYSSKSPAISPKIVQYINSSVNEHYLV